MTTVRIYFSRLPKPTVSKLSRCCPDTGTIESYTAGMAAGGESSQRFAATSTQLRHVVTALVSYPEMPSVKSDELWLRPNLECSYVLPITGPEPDYRVVVLV
jgi:hypothetical protein